MACGMISNVNIFKNMDIEEQTYGIQFNLTETSKLSIISMSGVLWIS